MVLYNLAHVWDDVPFYGKAIAAFFVMLQLGAFLFWLFYVRKELQRHKAKND
jgi:hypothetical protein